MTFSIILLQSIINEPNLIIVKFHILLETVQLQILINISIKKHIIQYEIRKEGCIEKNS